MRILFDPSRQIPPREAAYYLGETRLAKGVNEVDDSLTSHPDFDSLVNCGAISVLDEPLPVVQAKVGKRPVTPKEPE